ncbi:MbtH family NRPS accessory protein [Zooshikella ganghwensis]|uniref:MbtH family NRPS accessory protein n=1 Tax=Zooshikella ganghwensis TaxID=202772 RepID=UPI0003F8E10B|nr:MbtH family NRPS accessory protein [Zooshikella ganghwensis]
MSVFDLPMAHYQVVENHQGDLAVWPVSLVLPQGWQVRFSSDSTPSLSPAVLPGASNDAQNEPLPYKACCMKFIAQQSLGSDSQADVVMNIPSVNKPSSDQEATMLSSLQPAAQGITALFDHYDLVGLSEMHWHPAVIAAFTDLLRSDELAAVVDDIVVEFGNAAYQSVVDEYVAGAPVPETELVKAWQNTLNFVVWQPSGYQQLFKMVRQLNQQRPKSQQLRIVLAEPAFDWAQIKQPSDWQALQAARDQGYYQRIELEVLNKGRKGLMIFGGYHLTRQPVSRNRAKQVASANTETPAQKTSNSVMAVKATLGELLAEKQPGRSYMLWTTDILQFELRHRLLSTPSHNVEPSYVWPQVIASEQGWLGALPFAALNADLPVQTLVSAEQVPPVNSMVEGVLFLSGLAREVKLPESVVADQAWLSTMWQRTERLPKDFRQRLQSLLPDTSNVTDSQKNTATHSP